MTIMNIYDLTGERWEQFLGQYIYSKDILAPLTIVTGSQYSRHYYPKDAYSTGCTERIEYGGTVQYPS